MQLLIIMLATTCTQTTTHNLPHIRSRIGQGSPPPNAMELIDLFFATLQEKSNIGNTPCGPFLSRLPNYHTKERMPCNCGYIFFFKKTPHFDETISLKKRFYCGPNNAIIKVHRVNYVWQFIFGSAK